MRKELEPDMETAEKRYPKIKELIEKYTDYCDENGDEDNTEYKKLEDKLHEMTGKDMSQYDLWEWWEGEGLEVLAFRIALPEPNIVSGITKDELTEIVKRIKTDVHEMNKDDSFKESFHWYLEDYYQELLEINFKKTYEFDYFLSHKGKDGKYFEYTIDETVEKIWNKSN